jgi:hypothetical protein
VLQRALSPAVPLIEWQALGSLESMIWDSFLGGFGTAVPKDEAGNATRAWPWDNTAHEVGGCRLPSWQRELGGHTQGEIMPL